VVRVGVRRTPDAEGDRTSVELVETLVCDWVRFDRLNLQWLSQRFATSVHLLDLDYLI